MPSILPDPTKRAVTPISSGDGVTSFNDYAKLHNWRRLIKLKLSLHHVDVQLMR